jgi:hypothetical protein
MYKHHRSYFAYPLIEITCRFQNLRGGRQLWKCRRSEETDPHKRYEVFIVNHSKRCIRVLEIVGLSLALRT